MTTRTTQSDFHLIAAQWQMREHAGNEKRPLRYKEKKYLPWVMLTYFHSKGQQLGLTQTESWYGLTQDSEDGLGQKLWVATIRYLSFIQTELQLMFTGSFKFWKIVLRHEWLYFKYQLLSISVWGGIHFAAASISLHVFLKLPPWQLHN